MYPLFGIGRAPTKTCRGLGALRLVPQSWKRSLSFFFARLDVCLVGLFLSFYLFGLLHFILFYLFLSFIHTMNGLRLQQKAK